MSKIKILTTEANLGCVVDQDITAADTTIYLRFYDLISGEAREPDSSNRTNLLVTLAKDTKKHEILILGSVGAASANVSTCTSVIRGVDYDGLTVTAGTGNTHRAETLGGCANPSVLFNQLYRVMSGELGSGANLLRLGAETAADVRLVFQNNHSVKPEVYFDDSVGLFRIKMGDDAPASGDAYLANGISFTEAERNAITWPSNGPVIHNADSGEHERRSGGAWIELTSGGTFPNASTTVAGKKEDPTDAEFLAGTDTGGTGATMSPTPSQVAAAIQDGSFVYATSTTGNDTYAWSLTPAPSAYTTGMEFVVYVDTANTGACTGNSNSLGAKNIKLPNGNDPADGDILANSFIKLRYDGTNLVLVSPKGTLDNTTGGNEASGSHHHNGPENAFNSNRITVVDRFTNTVFDGVGGSLDDQGGTIYLSTGSSSNDYAGVVGRVLSNGTAYNIASKNPAWLGVLSLTDTTDQDGFWGIGGGTAGSPASLNGTLTGDHAGFILQDGQLFASVANGTSQEKSSDIVSANSITLTSVNSYYTIYNGSNYEFYVWKSGDSSATLVHTSTQYEPDNDTYYFTIWVKTAANNDKRIYIFNNMISFDK